MTQTVEFPKYDELPELADTGERHAWQVFGDRDQLGTLNFLDAAAVLRGLGTVREGRVCCLSLPLDEPNPSLSTGRGAYEHVTTTSRMGRDDSLNGFYLQKSSQWDGLQHIRFRDHGFYRGLTDAELDAGELGIDAMAEHGVIGRGVLVDLEAHFDRSGDPLDATRRRKLTVDDLEAAMASQGVDSAPGDILLVRTGFLRWYRTLDAAGRELMGGSLHGRPGGLNCPGLDPSAVTAGWLWDRRVAAVAADNPGVEVMQLDARNDGLLHRRILTMLGMPIGELWDLDGLADECRSRNRWEFLLVSAPLRLPAGVGSPANAYAVL